MKIYISHSKDFDFTNNLYIPLRNSEIDKHHKLFLPYENNKVISTKDIIKDSELVLAEVSYPSTGQGVELGWANVFNVPIICIYQISKGPASRSLKYIADNLISYENPKDMIEKLINSLSKTV